MARLKNWILLSFFVTLFILPISIETRGPNSHYNYYRYGHRPFNSQTPRYISNPNFRYQYKAPYYWHRYPPYHYPYYRGGRPDFPFGH